MRISLPLQGNLTHIRMHMHIYTYTNRKVTLMARKRNRLLVPEARQALDRLKCEVIQEAAPSPDTCCTVNPNDIKYTAARQVGVPLAKGDNGGITARQAGKVGGQMGGAVVRRLVELAREQLAERNPG